MIASDRDAKTEPNETVAALNYLNTSSSLFNLQGMSSQHFSRLTYNFISCYAEVLTPRYGRKQRTEKPPDESERGE